MPRDPDIFCKGSRHHIDDLGVRADAKTTFTSLTDKLQTQVRVWKNLHDSCGPYDVGIFFRDCGIWGCSLRTSENCCLRHFTIFKRVRFSLSKGWALEQKSTAGLVEA